RGEMRISAAELHRVHTVSAADIDQTRCTARQLDLVYHFHRVHSCVCDHPTFELTPVTTGVRVRILDGLLVAQVVFQVMPLFRVQELLREPRPSLQSREPASRHPRRPIPSAIPG